MVVIWQKGIKCMILVLKECKKMIRWQWILICIVVAVGGLLYICPRYLTTQEVLNTDGYPDKFTLYDNCSVDILFNDYLLDRYGNKVTENDLDDLRMQQEQLLNQIDKAAQKDVILLKNGMSFSKETMTFSAMKIDDTDEAERTISEDEQIYIWSCINGQMKLDGTDYPVGFLGKYQSTILAVKKSGTYDVLTADIFPVMRYSLEIVLCFSFASWFLLIPYGTEEAKSGTETMAFSSRFGRKSYVIKLFSMMLLSVLVVLAGVGVATLLFFEVGANRYFLSNIGTVMEVINMTAPAMDSLRFVDLYLIVLGMSVLLGVAGSLLVSHISLALKQGVTVVACAMPILIAEIGWLTYTEVALDYGEYTIPISACISICSAFTLLAVVISAGVIRRKYIKKY